MAQAPKQARKPAQNTATVNPPAPTETPKGTGKPKVTELPNGITKEDY